MLRDELVAAEEAMDPDRITRTPGVFEEGGVEEVLAIDFGKAQLLRDSEGDKGGADGVPGRLTLH